MGNITVKKISNEQDLITGLEIGGMLVLENARQLKKELAGVVDLLGKQLKIKVSGVTGLDISFIQLALAFIAYLDENHVTYEFEWNLSEEHRILLENVGFSNELFLN